MVRVLLCGVVVVLVLGDGLHAAVPPGNQPAVAQNQVIALRLSLSGRAATVKILNKACASVTIEGTETSHVYAQVVGEEVELAAWRGPNEMEPCSPPGNAGRARISVKGVTAFEFDDYTLHVQIVGLSTVAAGPAAAQGPCCVACQGAKFCGGDVDTACGTCCCGEAVGCQPGPLAQGIR